MNTNKSKKNQKTQMVQNKKHITLDKNHELKLQEFSKNEKNVIPKLESEKAKMKLNLKKKKINFDDQMNIIDKINNITKEIKVLKSKKKQYYLDNSKHIFTYFEDKKNISNDLNPKESTKNVAINNFFNIRSHNEDNEEINIVNNEETVALNIKDKYIEKYFNNVNQTIFDINTYIYPTDVCQYCNKGELIHIEEEGKLVCNICFRSVPYLFENEKPSYKEPPKEVCFYAYKRINHFKEILAQFQGKETTQISDEIIEKIKLQIKKERLIISQISNEKTKDILKKLGFNKYYEHITFIKSKLGIKPPIMSPELEDTLCNLFDELQTPYSKFCPDDRVNFLNYYYTIYKLCELLNQSQYLILLPMLKDREKIIEQDAIWKKICEDLNWKFIATI
jgi:hypothetical protein